MLKKALCISMLLGFSPSLRGFGNANCPNARGNPFGAESTDILL